jgi:tetratricopeptide (TPR) repeat protein
MLAWRLSLNILKSGSLSGQGLLSILPPQQEVALRQYFDDRPETRRVARLDSHSRKTGNMLASNRLSWIARRYLILCATARGRACPQQKGTGFAQVKAAEAHKEWDKALELAEQALSLDPAEINYQLTATRVRFEVSQFHIDRGKKLRGQGQLPEALADFEKAYAINPASSMAEEEARRTKGMIERNAKKPDATPEERGLTPAQQSRKDSEAKFATMLPPPKAPELPGDHAQMNNQPPKVLFEPGARAASTCCSIPILCAGRRQDAVRLSSTGRRSRNRWIIWPW